MKPTPLLIGLGAGLVSAVLFASAATGSFLALMLFYVAPLPNFLAGLGWGVRAAVVSGGAGSAAALLALGGLTGLAYLATIAVPATVLCYLALLSRPAPAAAGAGPLAPDAGQEWYPAGRIIMWAALMAGVLAAVSVPLLGHDAATYTQTIHKFFEAHVLKQMGSSAQNIGKSDIEAISALLARTLPAASAIIWMAVTLFNMWAGGKIVARSGQPLRPWPDLQAIQYPRILVLGLGVALLASFVPGLTGIMATGFSGAFLLAYMLLGLAVIHVMSRATRLRPILLIALYLGIVFFGWIALVVALVGLGEPIFHFRDRTPKTPPDARLGD